jgi:hypothetical protein
MRNNNLFKTIKCKKYSDLRVLQNSESVRNLYGGNEDKEELKW